MKYDSKNDDKSPTTIAYLRVSTIHQDLQKNKADILHLANDKGLGKVKFMSPCGIGLTPLPLGKHFSIMFGWNTEKVHIVHTI